MLEILLVVVVIGVLSGMGISAFSGATSFAASETAYNELVGFFNACRLHAKMRQKPIKIEYENGYLLTGCVGIPKTRLNADKLAAKAFFNNFFVDTNGVFYRDNKAVDRLSPELFNSGSNKAPMVLIRL